jgi:hypothetical protein
MTPTTIWQGVIVSQERGAILTQLHIYFKKIGSHLPSSFQSEPGVLWCNILATSMGFDKNASRSSSEKLHALFLTRRAGLIVFYCYQLPVQPTAVNDGNWTSNATEGHEG